MTNIRSIQVRDAARCVITIIVVLSGMDCNARCIAASDMESTFAVAVLIHVMSNLQLRNNAGTGNFHRQENRK